MKKILVPILVCISVVLLVCVVFQFKKIASLNEEIDGLRAEKIKLLAEHEECLTYKEKSLRKELIAKYLDSMMALASQAEQGKQLTEEETAKFYDRANFILDNIQSVDVSPEEAKLIISFVDSARKVIDQPQK